MRPSLAALRTLFRHLFSVFYKLTDRVLYKDMKCQWVLICCMMNSLSKNLEGKRDIELLVNELDHTIALLLNSNKAAIMIVNNLEKTERDEADCDLIEDIVADYNDLITMTALKLQDMKYKAKNGRLSKEDISYIQDSSCWPLLTDARAKEFLTEAFMQKTIRHFQRQPGRTQVLNR